jgi:hypothetical protein
MAWYDFATMVQYERDGREVYTKKIWKKGDEESWFTNKINY